MFKVKFKGNYYFFLILTCLNITGAGYSDMITELFLTKLNDIDVDDLWFQQDDACETILVLHEIIEKPENAEIHRRLAYPIS